MFGICKSLTNEKYKNVLFNFDNTVLNNLKTTMFSHFLKNCKFGHLRFHKDSKDILKTCCLDGEYNSDL